MEAQAVKNEVEIFDNDSTFLEVMESLLDDNELSENLSSGAVVALETTLDGNHLQDCYGTEIALRILKENPDKLVVCIGFLPLDFVRKQNYLIDIVLQYPNAFFVQLPLNQESFLEAFEKAKKQKPELLSEINSGEASWKYASDAISKAVHDLKVEDPRNPKNDYERDTVRKVVEDVRDVFPSLENTSDDEVIDFIYETNSQRREVMKGEEIQGVYCDIEGTLLVYGELNLDVVEMLESFEEKGKEVALWTDGDTDKLSSELKEFGVEYPVRSKIDFAGATAEIVIDDLDQFSFSARTKIRAEEFIQV